MLTYGRIFVEGPIGSIIGGDVTGVMGISTTSCGHESNVKDFVEGWFDQRNQKRICRTYYGT